MKETEDAFDRQIRIREAKTLKKLRLALLHLTGAGIVLVFGSLMAIAEMEIPVVVIMALTVGISIIMATFAVRLIIPFAFKEGENKKNNSIIKGERK